MPRGAYASMRLAEIAAEAPKRSRRVVVLARFIPKEPKAHDLKFGQSIYVMPAGPIVKVGISNNSHVRWRSLRTANPLIEAPVYVSKQMHFASRIETAAHHALGAYRVRHAKEWFRCNRYLAVEVVKTLIEEMVR